MKIDSPRYGTLDIEPDKIIEFPRGLPGFEACHRFSLFHPEGENPKYFILQSLDDVDVAFYLADPANFGFSYNIDLSDDEAKDIGINDPSDAVVVVMLTKPDATSVLSANLNSPLVINLAARRGIQRVFAKLDYAVAEAA